VSIHSTLASWTKLLPNTITSIPGLDGPRENSQCGVIEVTEVPDFTRGSDIEYHRIRQAAARAWIEYLHASRSWLGDVGRAHLDLDFRCIDIRG